MKTSNLGNDLASGLSNEMNRFVPLIDRLKAALGPFLIDAWAPADSQAGGSTAAIKTLVGGYTMTAANAAAIVASAAFGGHAAWSFDGSAIMDFRASGLSLMPAGSVPYCISYHRHTALVGGYNVAMACARTGDDYGWAIGGYAGNTAGKSGGPGFHIIASAPVLNQPRLVEIGKHSATHKRIVVDGVVTTIAGTDTADLVGLGMRNNGFPFIGETALQIVLNATPPDDVLASMRSVISTYFA